MASLPVWRQSHLRGPVALHSLGHALTLSMIGTTAMRTARTERSINTWSPTTTPALSCRKPTTPIEMSLLHLLLDWLLPSAHRQGRPRTLSPSIYRWAPCPRAGRHLSRAGKGSGERYQGASNGYGTSGTVHRASETGQTPVSKHQAKQSPKLSALNDRFVDCQLCDDAFQRGRGLTNHVRTMHREQHSEWRIQRSS